jgi:hypothetical protein
MSYYKFEEDDLFINTIEAYPQYRFYVQSGSIYINNMPHIPGINQDHALGVPEGFISLYEYNIDRPSGNNIYPFLSKEGYKDTFKTITKLQYNVTGAGDVIASSYNMSASISRDYYSTSTRSRINALRNVFDHYSYLSPHYQYSSSLGDKSSQTINLISIPSIAYGSGPAGSTGSGSVAGVVLYKEGFVALTGSWDLDSNSIAYDSTGTSKWIHFNYGANDGNSPALTTLSASFLMDYKGTTHTQTLTMFAHAKYGELNHSNNPTFVSSSDQFNVSTGSLQYIEQPKEIKNIVYSEFTDEDPEFKKTTYISKIAIYDDEKNLIGIAKVATPVRKTEEKQYTFKLKVDI